MAIKYFKNNENQLIIANEGFNEVEFVEITKEEYDTIKQTKYLTISAPMKNLLQKNKQIFQLKKQLEQTDYVAAKLAEAQAIYLVTNDKTKLTTIYNEYSSIIAERDAIRAQINQLEGDK